MKASITTLLCSSALALGLQLPANAGTANENARDAVKVQFLEPETYTDLKTTRLGGKEDRQALLEQLRQEVLQAADTYLPDGYKITLQFRDIDMAGEFEPQHGPALDDVRIIRPIYPPRLQVAYEVTNQQGDIVSRGQRRISDLAFDQIVSFRRDEPMFYVGELVRDLFRDVTRTLAG